MEIGLPLAQSNATARNLLGVVVLYKNINNPLAIVAMSPRSHWCCSWLRILELCSDIFSQLHHHPIGDAPIPRAINIKNTMSPDKLSVKPVTNSSVLLNYFFVYGLEEDESPPLEGDGMSARFIGELVHQEILCSWHQVVIATHTLRGVFSVFVRELRTYAYPQYFSIDP